MFDRSKYTLEMDLDGLSSEQLKDYNEWRKERRLEAKEKELREQIRKEVEEDIRKQAAEKEFSEKTKGMPEEYTTKLKAKMDENKLSFEDAQKIVGVFQPSTGGGSDPGSFDKGAGGSFEVISVLDYQKMDKEKQGLYATESNKNKGKLLFKEEL